MTDYDHPLRFGAFIVPDARRPEATMALALRVEALGLDVLGVQDHPYQASFLDTWTFLSTVVGQTRTMTLFPDVVNLPLRPPAVLARSVATLDLLSGGRVELGIGAGAFPQGIAAMGGQPLRPGASIEALAEAIEILRALWQPGGTVHFSGQHYRVEGAHAGPAPAHNVGIWVGSYKPRMLELTGRLADGWIPTLAYATPEQMCPMTSAIDRAAEDAGRRPGDIRRWYNISGKFAAHGSGFLDGPPRVWADQLIELALSQGFSGFILAPSGEDDLRRFVEEVAPAVREAIADERDEPMPAAPVQAPAAPVHGHAALDDTTRPHAVRSVLRHPEGAESLQGRASADSLVQMHDHLRSELATLRNALDQLAAGTIGPAEARSLLNQLTMRQNYWSVGAFCASYCRLLTLHHTIEDRQLFVRLRDADPGLGAVIERLSEEHEVIADVLVRVDDALAALIASNGDLAAARAVVDELSVKLLSHLSYEEDELCDPIAELGIMV